MAGVSFFGADLLGRLGRDGGLGGEPLSEALEPDVGMRALGLGPTSEEIERRDRGSELLGGLPGEEHQYNSRQNRFLELCSLSYTELLKYLERLLLLEFFLEIFSGDISDDFPSDSPRELLRDLTLDLLRVFSGDISGDI